MTSKQSNNESINDVLRNFDELPNGAFIRLPVIMALFSVSRASVWRWVKNGTIPKPIKLASRTCAWQVGEIRNLLTSLHSVKEK